MKLCGLIRLGRDAELRYTQEGKPVATLAGAWNYGKKGPDNKYPTQWVKLSLWGDRAESLKEYLTVGTALVVYAGDVHIETYTKNDGSLGFNLVGRVDDLTFAGGQRQQGEAQPQQRQQGEPRGRSQPPAPAPAPRGSTGTGFDDMDDDIPF